MRRATWPQSSIRLAQQPRPHRPGDERGGVGLDEVSDSDWMELTWRLAHHHPDEFFHVFQILAARNRVVEAPPVKVEEAEGEGLGSGTAAGRGPVEESAL